MAEPGGGWDGALLLQNSFSLFAHPSNFMDPPSEKQRVCSVSRETHAPSKRENGGGNAMGSQRVSLPTGCATSFAPRSFQRIFPVGSDFTLYLALFDMPYSCSDHQ